MSISSAINDKSRAIIALAAVLLASMVPCACKKDTTTAGTAREESAAAGLAARLDGYWRGIDPDSLTAEAREQHLVDYIYLTTHADSATRRQCWQAIAEVFPDEQPNRMVADYLGEPDSPLYAPALLREYLGAIAALFDEGSVQRARVDYLLAELSKNVAGQRIADLDVADAADGRPTTLHALVRQCGGDATVLFYDPECEECSAMISRLAGEPGPVIAVSIAPEAGKALPEGWQSCVVLDPAQLEERFYLPRLPQTYAVTPAALIK